MERKCNTSQNIFHKYNDSFQDVSIFTKYKQHAQLRYQTIRLILRLHLREMRENVGE